jgi:hypothetical protein
MIDNAGKERMPVPPSVIIGSGACIAQVAGMSGTLENIGMVI